CRSIELDRRTAEARTFDDDDGAAGDGALRRRHAVDSRLLGQRRGADEGDEERNSETDRVGKAIRSPGWGGWIRTTECRLQRPMPYHLATPQYDTGYMLSEPLGQVIPGLTRNQRRGFWAVWAGW